MLLTARDARPFTDEDIASYRLKMEDSEYPNLKLMPWYKAIWDAIKTAIQNLKDRKKEMEI